MWPDSGHQCTQNELRSENFRSVTLAFNYVLILCGHN